MSFIACCLCAMWLHTVKDANKDTQIHTCLVDAYSSHVESVCACPDLAKKKHTHARRQMDMENNIFGAHSSCLWRQMHVRHVECSMISSNYIQPVGLSEAERMFTCFFTHKTHWNSALCHISNSKVLICGHGL